VIRLDNILLDLQIYLLVDHRGDHLNAQFILIKFYMKFNNKIQSISTVSHSLMTYLYLNNNILLVKIKYVNIKHEEI